VGLSKTGVTFSGTAYYATSVSIKKSGSQIDVTALSDTQKQYMVSPLSDPLQATMDFVGYGPRAGTSGTFTCDGVAGVAATCVSSSTTFAVGDVVKSQATLQY